MSDFIKSFEDIKNCWKKNNTENVLMNEGKKIDKLIYEKEKW